MNEFKPDTVGFISHKDKKFSLVIGSSVPFINLIEGYLILKEKSISENFDLFTDEQYALAKRFFNFLIKDDHQVGIRERVSKQENKTT